MKSPWFILPLLAGAGAALAAGEGISGQGAEPEKAADVRANSVVLEASEIDADRPPVLARPGRPPDDGRVEMIMGGGSDGKARQATIHVLE